jgi:hypothetical protein
MLNIVPENEGWCGLHPPKSMRRAQFLSINRQVQAIDVKIVPQRQQL